MWIVIVIIIGALSWALFPTINDQVTHIDTTGWGTIMQGEFVVIPFLFLFAVVIVIWALRRKQG